MAQARKEQDAWELGDTRVYAPEIRARLGTTRAGAEGAGRVGAGPQPLILGGCVSKDASVARSVVPRVTMTWLMLGLITCELADVGPHNLTGAGYVLR